jgi:hypothetical protein
MGYDDDDDEDDMDMEEEEHSMSNTRPNVLSRAEEVRRH